MKTRTILLAFCAVVGLSTSLSAKDRMYCYQDIIANHASGGGLVRVNRFTVEVKPIPDPDNPEFMSCEATIRSPQGEVVFRYAEWGIEIDPMTGRDINGDGAPDVVLMSFSGGAHCCAEYRVISLGKIPDVIAQFGDRSRATFQDLGGDGKVEVVIRDGIFDEGFQSSHPYSPFPLLIVRLNGTRVEDVSSKFWPIYEKEIREERSKLKDNSLRNLLQSDPTDVFDEEDYLETKYRVLASL